MDPFNGLDLDEVVRLYVRWFRSAPRGFALVVYTGEPARREFLSRLAGRLNSLRLIDLSRSRDAQTAIEAMAAALEASDSVVFFGLDEALAPTSENVRLLNLNRERLASFGARQLWVVGPIWRQALLSWGFDLYSWFLPNHTIGLPLPDEGPRDPRPSEEAARPEFGPAATLAARRSASSLLDRFDRSYRDSGELSWDLMIDALQVLLSAGAYPDTYELLERAENLVAEIRRLGCIDSPSELRNLSAVLDNLGNVQRDLGRRDEALAYYEESLEIRRRLLCAYGETPQAQRDLSVALDNVGDVQSDRGRRDEALASYEESLGIHRRLLDAYGETPQAQRDLSVSLERVGGGQSDRGRRDEALASYEESLGILRRLLDAYGETPQALRDLSVSLNKVGDVQSDRGRRDEALASYEESLGICRRLLDSYGESPQALRDLSVSLERVADLQSDRGRRHEALASYEESLVIRRRLLDAYGETPQALRDLSVSLERVGYIQSDRGRRDEALASFEESLGICRRLLDAYGESPQVLRDLSVSLNKVGDVQSDRGRKDEALASYEESLGICRRLLDSYGESPQALRDVAVAAGSLARELPQGSPERRDALAEATDAIERAIKRYGEFPDLLETRSWLQGLA